jgi:hypothetical protein
MESSDSDANAGTTVHGTHVALIITPSPLSGCCITGYDFLVDQRSQNTSETFFDCSFLIKRVVFHPVTYVSEEFAVYNFKIE